MENRRCVCKPWYPLHSHDFYYANLKGFVCVCVCIIQKGYDSIFSSLYYQKKSIVITILHISTCVIINYIVPKSLFTWQKMNSWELKQKSRLPGILDSNNMTWLFFPSLNYFENVIYNLRWYQANWVNTYGWLLILKSSTKYRTHLHL